MKVLPILLLSISAYDIAYASLANLLADRAVTKLTKWLKSEGSIWVTLPGGYKMGQTPLHKGKFTLAFAGPELGKIGAINRSGEAELVDGDPDPSCTTQKLRFVVSFQNITFNYEHVSYNEGNYGCFNLTSQATSDAVSAAISINLEGHGDSCLAVTNSMDVNFNGSLWITLENLTENRYVTPVIEGVKNHFKNNVAKAIGTLLKTAIFDSLEYYDICTGTYYPQTPPNVLADSVLHLASGGLEKNISVWATLPAFSKKALVNDTYLDVIKVFQGNFSSFGNITRIGQAYYENQANPKFMDLNLSFEVSSLKASYGKIEYIDFEIWHLLAEQVTAPKIITTLTITFARKMPNSLPSCVGGSVVVKSKYSGRDPSITNLTPGVPHYVVRSVNEVLGPGFIATVERAANDLFLNATIHALRDVCN